jgi:hypothetical protein
MKFIYLLFYSAKLYIFAFDINNLITTVLVCLYVSFMNFC